MNLSKNEEQLSQYIDELNQTGQMCRGQSHDQEWNEILDTVNLIKLSNIIEMPDTDFQEKVRQKVKQAAEEHQQKSKPAKKHSWKTYYFPLVAACLMILSYSLPTLFPDQKVVAQQISVVKEEQLVPLGMTKVNNPIMLSDGKTIGFEKNEKIVTWNKANQTLNEFPLDSFQYMRSPAWSPDEQKIAFSGYKTKNAGIWLMNSDGMNVRNLAAPESPNEFYDHPTWSPDGKKIAFAKLSYISNDSHGFTQANEEICVVNIRTGKVTKITNGSEPSWSPNGKTIAFTRTRLKEETIHKEVWLVNADGSNPRKLAEGMEPSWSPDGQFIAFAKTSIAHQKVKSKEIVTSFREIWAIHIDSRKLSSLTKSKVNEQQLNHLISSTKTNSSQLPVKVVTSGQYGDWQPSWSKDGKSIVFVRDTNDEKGDHFSLMKLEIKYE